jgi:hypothetical protein
MSENTFLDEDLPAGKLPRWATITQVCDSLGISRTTVTKVVKKAWDNSEPWVKKENAPDGNTHYLIDTEHATYQSHEERWKQYQASQRIPYQSYAEQWKQNEADLDDLDIDEFGPDELFPWQRESLVPYQPVPLSEPENRESGLHRWPRLRRWLHAQGVQVFTNIVSEPGEENLWHWRWGDLHGEGYASDEEAIVAALQSRFDTNEAVVAALQSQLTANPEKPEEQDTALVPHPLPQELYKPHRRSFFSRGDSSRFFC